MLAPVDPRWAWRLTGLFGAIGVLLAAFGAHGLDPYLDEASMQTWQTAARFHLFHALALGLSAAHPSRPRLAVLGFGAGIVLFSGSLYVMAVSDLNLGPITPLGGLAFVAGWTALAMARADRPPTG
jgi:uncharacterized membrane protein YgdD (TMEM256/DUF423 family)